MKIQNQPALAKAYRFINFKVYYVCELPGQEGVDWGYIRDGNKGKLLNKYWQARFAKDMERVGEEAFFI